MCQYITAYVPLDADIDAVRTFLDHYKFGCRLIENPHVSKQFVHRVVQILTTRKYCDCGTSLGVDRLPDSGREPSDRDVERRRKKGWSEARILRWRAEKTASLERDDDAV